MADTLAPAVLNETSVQGDTYEGTWSIEEGTSVADAVPVDISGRGYTMTIRDTRGNLLTQITTTSSADGVITRNADSTIGRIRWRVDQTATVDWPIGPLFRDLQETRDGNVQTLFVGTIQLQEGVT